MFMVVSFPWPVASAYAGLVGPAPVRDAARRRDTHSDTRSDERAQRELVGAAR
jgi:hypothetical protein